jgi:hypothetical protein
MYIFTIFRYIYWYFGTLGTVHFSSTLLLYTVYQLNPRSFYFIIVIIIVR